jgi:hypothetical protein
MPKENRTGHWLRYWIRAAKLKPPVEQTTQSDKSQKVQKSVIKPSCAFQKPQSRLTVQNVRTAYINGFEKDSDEECRIEGLDEYVDECVDGGLNECAAQCPAEKDHEAAGDADDGNENEDERGDQHSDEGYGSEYQAEDDTSTRLKPKNESICVYNNPRDGRYCNRQRCPFWHPDTNDRVIFRMFIQCRRQYFAARRRGKR